MKHVITFVLLILFINYGFGQTNLAGNYNVSGYFFRTTGSRSLNLTKKIKQISVNTYQVDIADYIGVYSFQFQIDSNNNLTNFVLVPSGSLPAAGFMTLDNPGNFTFPGVTTNPGQFPYLSTIYNNTYDPINHTFYMHYGYNSASNSDQTGYTRQTYEKWTIIKPITAFSPTQGTTGTPITIYGKGFSSLNGTALNGIVYFGDYNYKYHEDSLKVLSDSVLIAWVGRAVSGKVYISLRNGSQDSLDGFTYTPIPAITNSGWSYLGKPGFTTGNASNYVNAACGTNNIPYVAYVDSATGESTVMKYSTSGAWTEVGQPATIGKSTIVQLILDNQNNPIVAFADSANGGVLTIKKYNGNNWIKLGSQNFGNNTSASLAVDNNGILYVETIRSYYSTQNNYISNDSNTISVFKYDGTIWDNVGDTAFAKSNHQLTNLTIDKKNNIPYIVIDQTDHVSLVQATVKRFDGINWLTVGDTMFTSKDCSVGAFDLDIAVDSKGAPLVSAQADDGFERASVYKYSNEAWNALGYSHFSKAHSYWLSFALNKKDRPFLLFSDDTYNGQGTVMSYTDAGSWQTVGSRGIVPGVTFTRNSLVIDTSNNPIIAFYDNTQGGKVSVMRYGSNILPVSFINFDAIRKEHSISLGWNTANERNVSNYIVEHSVDAAKFTPIGTLNANQSNYQFADNNPYNGINYYRLESVDKNGVVSYSKVVSVQFTVTSNQLTVFPNPAKNSITIGGSHIVSVQVVDNMGKIIKTQALKDTTNPTLSIIGLSAGIYHLRVQTSDGKVSVAGLVKE